MPHNNVILFRRPPRVRPGVLLWLSDQRGIYIPRDFATSFTDRDKSVSGVEAEDWAVLEAGPDHDLYWDVWEGVLISAIITDNEGVKYTLHQDGDLWLVPEGMVWSDDEHFVWPDEEGGNE